jgi:hypothetical protein
MVAVDPTYGQSHDAADWDAADGAAVTDALADLTDDDTATTAVTQGQGTNDIVRMEFPGLSGIAAGDTITVHFDMTMNYTTMVLLPYSSATGVTTTNKLSYTMSGGTPAVFTLTSAWITDLFDQGSDTFACRIVEDLEIDGSVELTEVDSDLTVILVAQTHQMII